MGSPGGALSGLAKRLASRIRVGQNKYNSYYERQSIRHLLLLVKLANALSMDLGGVWVVLSCYESKGNEIYVGALLCWQWREAQKLVSGERNSPDSNFCGEPLGGVS